MQQRLNRIIYVSFIFMGLYSLIMHEFLASVGLLGLAILFDPFDIKQGWSKKPSWQKAVFVVQGILVIGIFIPLMGHFWSNW